MSENPAQLQATFVVPYQGRRLEVDLLDFTGQDEADFHEKTGREVTELLQGDFTIRSIAGLVWIHLRRGKPKLTFEEVNGAFSLRDLAGVETPDDHDADGEAEGKGPEA